MNAHVSGIKKYFDQTADRFDTIYRTEKPWSQRVVDAMFRGTVNRRYELIMADLGDVSGQTVLDVGTGSGRYAVELAVRGAKVTGLDFAGEMLRLAASAARERKVADQCRWVQGELSELTGHEPFDVILAIGFWDYVRDPRSLLTNMRSLASGTLYFSFPRRWTLRTLPRKIRLFLNGCYVRFYARKEIDRLLSESGFGSAQIQVTQVNRDFIVKVRAV